MLTYAPFLLRWAARLSAIFVAGTYTLMVAGEFFSRTSGFPMEFREWAGILLLTSACAGMVVAWRRELLGALWSLTSLALFGFFIQLHQMEVLMVAAIPGSLYLVDWAMRRTLMGPERTYRQEMTRSHP